VGLLIGSPGEEASVEVLLTGAGGRRGFLLYLSLAGFLRILPSFL